MLKRFFTPSMLMGIGIALMVGLVPISGTTAVTQDTSDGGKGEPPTELTDEEYMKDVEAFYTAHSDLVIIVDLANSKGIAASLLPEDLRGLAESGVTIVAYRETIRADKTGGKPNGHAVLCAIPAINIGCAPISGSRDLTTSKVFGSVTQFARTIALRYDWFPPCVNNCFGWEVEKQYMWWTRTISTWTVKNGRMGTRIDGQNYCTEADASLNYSSSTVASPTWSGNQTSKYLISGFPNNAYVPLPNTGYSYTQGDIYQGTVLKYNDARNNQWWPTYD